jgi:hypothetical protein
MCEKMSDFEILRLGEIDVTVRFQAVSGGNTIATVAYGRISRFSTIHSKETGDPSRVEIVYGDDFIQMCGTRESATALEEAYVRYLRARCPLRAADGSP